MLGAAECGYAGVIRLLLQISLPSVVPFIASAETSRSSPLHHAALGGHVAAFKLLLAAAPEAAASVVTHIGRYTGSAHLSYSRWSLMHSAAHSGSVGVMRALLELAPAAASWVTDDGLTPLHTACDAGQVDAAQLLLDVSPGLAATAARSPIEPKAPARRDWLPLHVAATNGNVAVIQLLLAAGAPGLDMSTLLATLPCTGQPTTTTRAPSGCCAPPAPRQR